MKDALAAVTYDQEFWTDEVDRLSDDADRFDNEQGVRMLLRAARIVRLESADDPRLEELLKRIFVKDIDEPSANFIYETVLATNTRWDELEKHQLRRADRAGDHGKRIEALRMFALEWVQRFKDKDRGAKFFDAALRANTSNGEASMRSVVAAFTLLRQVQGDKGEWQQLLELADAVIAKVPDEEDRLFVAIQAGNIAFDKLNDVERAKRYFSVAASIAKDNPSVQDFASIAGPLGEAPLASGSMPAMPVVTDVMPVVKADDSEAQEAPAPGKKSKKERKADEAAAKAEAERVEAEAKAVADAADATNRAAADKAAADKAAADAEATAKASADKAAADHAAAEAKAAGDKAAAEKSEADRAARAEADAKAAAEAKAAADKVAADLAAAKEVPADLGAALEKAKNAEGGADKGVLGWKDVVAKFPTDKAPRRELARVLRQAASWAQLADALKDEEAKASPTGPEKATVFLELADTYGKLNNDNQVIAALNNAIHGGSDAARRV